MLHRIAAWILRFPSRYIQLSEDRYACCEYGVEAFLYTFMSTGLMLVLGAMLGMLLPACVIIAVFYVDQTVGGGYHTSTHLRCFLTMAAGLCAGLGLTRIPLSPAGYWLAGMLCCGILYTIPLTLHPNKAYLKDKKRILKARSRILSIAEAVICTILWLMQYGSLGPFCAGLLLSAVSRAVAKRLYPPV